MKRSLDTYLAPLDLSVYNSLDSWKDVQYSWHDPCYILNISPRILQYILRNFLISDLSSFSLMFICKEFAAYMRYEMLVTTSLTCAGVFHKRSGVPLHNGALRAFPNLTTLMYSTNCTIGPEILTLKYLTHLDILKARIDNGILKYLTNLRSICYTNHYGVNILSTLKQLTHVYVIDPNIRSQRAPSRAYMVQLSGLPFLEVVIYNDNYYTVARDCYNNVILTAQV